MNTYKLVNELNPHEDPQELDSDELADALEEALEILGYRVVIAKEEEEVAEEIG